MTGSRLIVLFFIVNLAWSTVPSDSLPDIYGSRISPSLRNKLDPIKLGDNQKIDVVLDLDSPPTYQDIEQIEKIADVQSVVGEVATAIISPSQLYALDKVQSIRRIEFPRVLRPVLDVSVPEIGAPITWKEISDSRGMSVDGSGVLIGFVDTGIDTTHPDFRLVNGSSKILFVWDQTQTGKAPKGFSYGRECSRREIESAECVVIDTHGHGTHVAGIAAGSGLANKKFSGVAPSASIVFVKSGHPTCNGQNWFFEDAKIIDAVRYISDKGRELGMRTVVNLSLGGDIGGHDDTSALEKALNQLADEGVIVVAAAGNSAEDRRHISGRFSDTASVSIIWETVPRTRSLQVDLWSGALDTVSVSLATPDGDKIVGPTKPGGSTLPFGTVAISNVRGERGQEWLVEVKGNSDLLAEKWSLEISARSFTGDGRWDAWIQSDTCDSPSEKFIEGTGYQIETTKTVSIPGTASRVITVGAYVTKTSWLSQTGAPATFRSSAGPGNLASFSSVGPTRDGRAKPDITAPGVAIASARSSQTSRVSADPTDFHTVRAGTSMATPHVAGVAALILQFDNSLGFDQLSAIIRTTARQDVFTGEISSHTPSKTWGWGKLEAKYVFRVELASKGLDSFEVPVRVDDAVKSLGSEPLVFFFRKDTTHTATVQRFIQISPGARLSAQNTTLAIDNPGKYVFEFLLQYFLRVDSPYDSLGEGWYDSGAEATFDSLREVKSGEGLRKILKEWRDESGVELQGNRIVMTRPRRVTAVYTDFYGIGLLAAGLPSVATIRFHLDGKEAGRASGGQLETVLLEPGRTSIVSLDPVVMVGEGVRYVLASPQISVREPGVYSFMYRPEYLLVLKVSPGQSVERWVGSQQKTVLETPGDIPMEGIPGLLGGRLRFQGWEADGKKIEGSEIVVESPKTLTALYSPDLIMPAILSAVVGTLLAAVYFLKKKGALRGRSPTP